MTSNVIEAKAVSFKEVMDDSFKEYQEQVLSNAKALADALKERGFKLVSDGTDNHLMLVNLTNKNMTEKKQKNY